MADLELGRDVLDKQLVDRRGVRMGKVDGILLRLHADGPPEVAWLEVGAAPLLERVSGRLADAASALARRLGVGSGEPLRITPEQIVRFGRELHVDVDASRTNAFAWERWLRRFVEKVPGARA